MALDPNEPFSKYDAVAVTVLALLMVALFWMGSAMGYNNGDVREAELRKAHASLAPRGKGWECTGPPNVKIPDTDYYTLAPGTVNCHTKRCKTGPRCPKRDPRWVIRQVFTTRGSQAIRVAWCESKFYTHAGSPSTYLGAFQMGVEERETYGHGSGLWNQARYARRYFIAAGKNWGPWQCRP